MLQSLPLPTDAFIKPDASEKLILDKTSQKQISKVVLAKRGHRQTLASCVTGKNKFVLLLQEFFFLVQIKYVEKFHCMFFLLFFFSFFAPSFDGNRYSWYHF